MKKKNYFNTISELKMTLYKRESLGFLLVLIEMRHYFLKTILFAAD